MIVEVDEKLAKVLLVVVIANTKLALLFVAALIDLAGYGFANQVRRYSSVAWDLAAPVPRMGSNPWTLRKKALTNVVYPCTMEVG